MTMCGTSDAPRPMNRPGIGLCADVRFEVSGRIRGVGQCDCAATLTAVGG